MVATDLLLDAAGIVHAGTGRIWRMRAPVFLDTPKGADWPGRHARRTAIPRGKRRAQVGDTAGGRASTRLVLTYHVVTRAVRRPEENRAAVFTAPPGTSNATKLPDREPTDTMELFSSVWVQGRQGCGHEDVRAEQGRRNRNASQHSRRQVLFGFHDRDDSRASGSY